MGACVKGLRWWPWYGGAPPRPSWGVRGQASPLRAQKCREGVRGRESGIWMLTSAPAPPHPAGGVLWNMMRSWPGSGRPTSTHSTSSWDQGGMSRGLLRRPLTSLLKVGGRGSLVGDLTPTRAPPPGGSSCGGAVSHRAGRCTEASFSARHKSPSACPAVYFLRPLIRVNAPEGRDL